MSGAVELNIFQFSIVYLLLLVVLAVMKKCKIDKTKMLLVAGVRMTVQLMLAGFILTYIFANPHPVLTIAYLISMTAFAIHRVLSQNKHLNHKFKLAIGFSLAVVGMTMLAFFVGVIVGVNVFDPQYSIPISGMIMGNAMTGMSLGLRNFNENLSSNQNRITTLLNLGVSPDKILLPFVNSSLETALLPTLNNMIGMGIVSLPGMMTGQMLSGTLPTTAILYQISIMITICTVVCLSVFSALYLGYKTLYNNEFQIEIPVKG